MPETTLQPDASAGIDTWINELSATTNYGTSTTMQFGRNDTGGGGQKYIPIFKFDLSAIAPGSQIQEVKLTLNCTSVFGNAANAKFALIKSGNTGWTEGGATWNTIDGSGSWAGSAGCQTAGTDYDDDDVLLAIDLAVNPYDTAVDHEFTFTPTAFQKLIDIGNFGIVMLPVHASGGTSRTRVYKTSDHGDTADRPALFVRWLDPAGRLVEYTFNIWDPAKQVLDSKGAVVQPNEVRPNNWIRAEGFELPRGRAYASLVEDPTTSYIVGANYDEDRGSVRIVTDRNQFAELIVKRLAGA